MDNYLAKHTQQVTVTNELAYALNVYDTFSKEPPDVVPSLNAADYYPVYTLIGTIPANSDGTTIHTIRTLSRLVITAKSSDFPLHLFVPPLFHDKTKVTISQKDEDSAKEAKRFYVEVMSQPYSPVTLQYRGFLLHVKDILSIEPEVTKFLKKNGYQCDYFLVNLMTYWYANSLSAWTGTYYCYEPNYQDDTPLVLPKKTIATLKITNSQASYVPHEGETIALNYSADQLTSADSSSTSGLQLKSLIVNLESANQQYKQVSCFVGKNDGNELIAQPTKDPSLAWWIIAYDVAYGIYSAVQIYMMLDMAMQVLKGIQYGVKYLSEKIASFLKSMQDDLEAQAEDFDPAADFGDDIEVINIGVNVNTVTDTVIHDVMDTTIQEVVKTVDVVDINVDADVDVDVGIDLDVDVDTDIDTDVDLDGDLDINVKTNIDTVDVVNIDINTEVNVEPGMLINVLKHLGQWAVTKMFPELVKLLVIQAAFYGADKLLAVWKEKAEEDLANLFKPETAVLGLLINYMLNPHIALLHRWMTFADFADQAATDDTKTTLAQQKILLTTVLMTKNPPADIAQKNWHWSLTMRNDLINKMVNAYLGGKTYQDIYKYLVDDDKDVCKNPYHEKKHIPIKVGCSVALRFLNEIS